MLLQDSIRCFLCVLSISLLSQDDTGSSNVRTNSSKNFSISANYLLLLIDCVLFYFIKLNRITIILMLRIIYLLVSVSLIMFFLSNQQIVTKNCCATPKEISRDLLVADSANILNKFNLLAHNRTTAAGTVGNRTRIKKKKIRILKKSDSMQNCSKQAFENYSNSVAIVSPNVTSADFQTNIGHSELSDFHLNMQLYFRYTEIVLVILSMIVYSLSIFTIDIYFFQKPYT